MQLELGGGNSKIFWVFSPLFAEDEPNLRSIFFRWVETTNQTRKSVFLLFLCFGSLIPKTETKVGFSRVILVAKVFLFELLPHILVGEYVLGCPPSQ